MMKEDYDHSLKPAGAWFAKWLIGFGLLPIFIASVNAIQEPQVFDWKHAGSGVSLVVLGCFQWLAFRRPSGDQNSQTK